MKYYILLALMTIGINAMAQNVGIGTNSPTASAALEIKASNKGLLIPRTSTATRISFVNPAKGLLVYDTTTSSFWYHNGTAWTQIGSGGNGWSLTGNANTDSLVNFIGTTNPEALVFKVNNQRSGFIGYGTSNTGFGYNTLTAITTGNYNTANGTGSLLANNTGYNNTASGSYALSTNGGGSFNVAMGSDALHNNISGNSNTATGFQALYFNTGDNNTATGRGALFTNTTGSHNTANGINSLVLNSSGNNNIANGEDALHYNNTGNDNIATGLGALFFNTTGYSNIAIGTRALVANTVGHNMVAIGDSALFSQSVSDNDNYINTAVGSKALYSNTTGSGNTANGSYALFANGSGSSNTAYGFSALFHLQTGSNNTAIGFGADVDPGHVNLTNTTAIGANARVFNSNTIQLGDGNVTSVNTHGSIFASGSISAQGYNCKAGAGGLLRENIFNIDWSSDGTAQLYIDFTNLGTISFTSDRRLKDNIDLMKSNGIERMMALKPVHFKYKKIAGTIFSGSPQEQEGFIADELQQVIPSAVNGEKNALTSKGTIQPQTVNIVPVVAVLTKAVQEQQQQIETLKKENEVNINKIDQEEQQINLLVKEIKLIKDKMK